MQRQSRDRQTDKGRFLEIARDPRIIPGLHRACDEWCDYCPLTDRCLLFRCTREFHRVRRRPAPRPAARASAAPTRASPSGFRTASEAMAFARDFASVDVTPALGTREAASARKPEVADDDAIVAGIALEYVAQSQDFAAAVSTVRRRGQRGEPPPVDAILRFRTRIYFKTMRALVGYRLTAAGLAHRCADGETCACQTLAYIDRSRAALAQFPDGERRGLVALLDAIACGIEARFPDARSVRKLFSVRAA